MKVLILGDFDTAGQGVRIVEAFRRFTDWEVRSMVKSAQYMAYPKDLPFRSKSAEEMYQWADVIHVRNHFDDYDRLSAKFGPKPVVYHAHGTKFRGNPNHYLRQARERRAQVMVSTLDLWLLAGPDAVWLPAPYDVDWLASM